ncbi:MAG: ATPase P [Acidimicrobiia bacterium]|nr:ATPase P [Acidimicrobiia bacterium]
MIKIEIPGRPPLVLEYLVTDFNGTIAERGCLLDGVGARLRTVSEQLQITVLTADTFGQARNEMRDLPVEVVILSGGNEDAAKAAHVLQLGSSHTIALGNGHNDRLMLEEAALGLVVIQGEGTASTAMEAGDVLFRDVRDALDALLDPQRLVATLRS